MAHASHFLVLGNVVRLLFDCSADPSRGLELDDDELELELPELEFLVMVLPLFSVGNLLEEGACF